MKHEETNKQKKKQCTMLTGLVMVEEVIEQVVINGSVLL